MILQGSTLSLLLGALAAGFVGSPHCVAMCGGFAASCAQRPSGAVAWHAGRLSTYAILGAIAALAGRALPGPAWVPAAVSSLLLVWFAGALAGLLPEPRLAVPGLGGAMQRLLTSDAPGSRFLFGMANGLLPCGLVYAALALPVTLRSAPLGALAMVVFGLGTVPALATLAVGVADALRRGLWPRRALAAGMLVVGLWAIAMRAGWIGGAMQHAPGAEHQHGARP
jgi:sulfite exporter TauE/SafE